MQALNRCNELDAASGSVQSHDNAQNEKKETIFLEYAQTIINGLNIFLRFFSSKMLWCSG